MSNTEVVIVAGARTPFARAGTDLQPLTARELGTRAVSGLLEKTGFPPDAVEALCFGTVVLDPRVPNAAREIVFDTPLPAGVQAHTVSSYCITGIRTLTDLADMIAGRRIETGIAVGADSLSNPPLLFRRTATRVFTRAAAAKTATARVRALLGLRPGHFMPDAPGVAEPSTGLTMGEHCEITAKAWNIPRQVQDEIALRSHQRAVAAWEDGRLAAEVVAVNGFARDNLLRPDTTASRLSKLKPVFDRRQGTLTAGNSSPLTDGAAAVLVMSAARAERENLEPLAVVRDWEYAAIDPADGLLMAPAVAAPRLLARHGLCLDDMDLVEVHEAFGAQVAANLAAWESGWKEPSIGRVDPERLNVCGSSIAVGHPFAATGGRILTTLANEMQRRNARRGLVSICAAGAMAAAVLLERP